MRERSPDVEELYSEARKTDRLHVDNWRDDELEWSENSEAYEASNFFVWDVEPGRFNHSTEVPEEIVVLPDTYEGFVEGAGFLVRTPLYDDQDLEDAKEVLGEENIVGKGGGGFRGVEDLDTPKDVMQLHQLADRLGIDVYTPSEWDYGLPHPEESGNQVIDDWRQTAFQGVENFVDNYTTDATGRWSREVIDEFTDNGKRTAFITYASRDGNYTEEDMEYINETNEGGLSYHTPFTMNQILGGNVLEAD
ncbi:MAG: hypothetical protein ACI977_000216 [Candidatus Nanohaloarchaea archaeon]|jgi:hypothetical protein